MLQSEVLLFAVLSGPPRALLQHCQPFWRSWKMGGPGWKRHASSALARSVNCTSKRDRAVDRRVSPPCEPAAPRCALRAPGPAHLVAAALVAARLHRIRVRGRLGRLRSARTARVSRQRAGTAHARTRGASAACAAAPAAWAARPARRAARPGGLHKRSLGGSGCRRPSRPRPRRAPPRPAAAAAAPARVPLQRAAWQASPACACR